MAQIEKKHKDNGIKPRYNNYIKYELSSVLVKTLKIVILDNEKDTVICL